MTDRPPLARHPRLAAILVAALVAVFGLIVAVGLYLDPRPSGELHWPFTVGWVGWGLWFGVLEWIAVRRKPKGGKGGGGDTLSEHVWFLVRRPLFALPLAGVWCWLGLHFFTPWA